MGEDLPVWAQIAIAVFGTGGGAAALVSLAREAAKARRARQMDRGLHDTHEIYRELQMLLHEVPQAQRIHVVKSHNGGGLPQPGNEIKSTVVYEVFAELPSLRETWKRVPIDQEYSGILSVLSAGQWVCRKGSRLASRSVLRDMLEEEVSLLVFVRICSTNSALWYIALHFRDCEELSEQHRAKIRQTVYRLRLLFGAHQPLLREESPG